MSGALIMAHMRYQLQRHGWPAAAGLFVLLAALALQLLWVDSLHARNAELHQELSAQRQAQAQKPQASEARAQAQAAFFATLPDATEAVEAIAVLNQAAARNKVSLVTAEYRVTRLGTGPLLRYQISVPLRADYVHLHAWLAQVMNALPHAALDEVSLRRDDVGQDLLDAHVRFTVFLRAP
ncbi:hypothetical protein [Rhodoferax sp. GW822-FHT02A01]|uniref:hypothetical protein n=1 Tax=Rhodoferax sp. GW822-FHT02A01 TaxID=3141537 RepID=UPI00315C8077